MHVCQHIITSVAIEATRGSILYFELLIVHITDPESVFESRLNDPGSDLQGRLRVWILRNRRMEEPATRFRAFENDSRFIHDYLESLASGENVDEEFPDMVMLVGFFCKMLLEGGMMSPDQFRVMQYKNFRRLVLSIKWDTEKHSRVLFEDYTMHNISNALNTPIMRAAYRVAHCLYPTYKSITTKRCEYNAWEFFHIISGRARYAGSDTELSELYFQMETPHIKPKQILGKKIFDGIFKAGFNSRFELILFMLLCWDFEKKRKVEDSVYFPRKGTSITSGNTESIACLFKMFLDGWTAVATTIFNSQSLEALLTPYILFDFPILKFRVLQDGLFSMKEHFSTFVRPSTPVPEIVCDFEEIQTQSSEENGRIRRLKKSFFENFKDVIEILRLSKLTDTEFKEKYGARQKECPKRKHIPEYLWNTLENLLIVKRDTFPSPPEGMPTYSILPKHIVRQFVVRFQCWDLEKELEALCLNEWPTELQKKFSSIPIFSLLAVDEKEFNVRVSPSSIPNSGLGVFAKDDLEKSTVVGWYNGCILYRDLELDEYPRAIYGNPLFGCTLEQFKKYAIEVNASGVFLVAPDFCIAGKVIDPRSIGAETAPTNNEPNCIFSSMDCPLNRETLKSPFIVTIKTSKNIKAGEELFVDYGGKYNAWS